MRQQKQNMSEPAWCEQDESAGLRTEPDESCRHLQPGLCQAITATNRASHDTHSCVRTSLWHPGVAVPPPVPHTEQVGLDVRRQRAVHLRLVLHACKYRVAWRRAWCAVSQQPRCCVSQQPWCCVSQQASRVLTTAGASTHQLCRTQLRGHVVLSGSAPNPTPHDSRPSPLTVTGLHRFRLAPGLRHLLLLALAHRAVAQGAHAIVWPQGALAVQVDLDAEWVGAERSVMCV